MESFGFSGESGAAFRSEAIVAPTFVVGEAGFLDESVAHEPVEGAVEGAGAHGDGSAVPGAGLLHDEVAVFIAVGESEQDGEDGGGEGRRGSGFCCHAL